MTSLRLGATGTPKATQARRQNSGSSDIDTASNEHEGYLGHRARSSTRPHANVAGSVATA